MNIFDYFKKLKRRSHLKKIRQHRFSPVLIRQEELESRISEIRHVEHTFLIPEKADTVLFSLLHHYAHEGDAVLIYRNVSLSVHRMISFLRLKPYYFLPEQDSSTGFFGSVNSNVLEQMLDQHPEIKLVLMSNPTPAGILSDVRNIVAICHKKKVKIIVDERYGTHLDTIDYFSGSSTKTDADAILHSIEDPESPDTHITILLCNHASPELSSNLSLFCSLALSETAITFLSDILDAVFQNPEYITDWADNIRWFSDKLTESNKFIAPFYGRKAENHSLVFSADRSKMILSGPNVNGFTLFRTLTRHHFPVLTASGNSVVVNTTLFTTKKELRKLLKLLSNIQVSDDNSPEFHIPNTIPKRILLPEVSEQQKKQTLFFGEAEDETCGEYIVVNNFYHAVILPGEQLTSDVLSLIPIYKKAGADLSMADKAGRSVVVIKQ